VDDSLLLDEYEDWNDYTKLIDSYFKNVAENWEESAEEFIANLLKTLERLNDRRGTHVEDDKLLTDVQDKQDEDEISEAEEYDSFITDQSDETYKTEDSIYYADNLK
ncbi:hypothetical protein CU098_007086, partial [Rhizopus stolonifer]